MSIKDHHSKSGCRVLIALLAWGVATWVPAQTYTWDPTGSTAGGSDGSNAWDAGVTKDWYNGTTATGWDNDGTISASIGLSSAGSVGSPNTITIATATTINVAGITFNNVTPYTSGGESLGYIIAPTNSSSILNLQGSGSIVDNTAAGTVTIIGTQITGTAGLTLSGTGTLALTGADSYTGGTTVSAGSTLQIGNGGSTGSFVGNVTDNGVLAFDNSGVTPLTTASITSGPSGDVVTYTPDIISGSGSVLLMSGTLILSGSDTYMGGTTVDGGLLQLANTSGLGSASGPLVVNGGTVDLSGYSVTVGSLNGNGGTILSNSGTATLTVANGGTYAGALQNGAGTLALTLSGGTLVLTGTNAYNGATTITSGTLQFGNGGTTGSLTTLGAISDNGSLVFDNTSAGTVATLSGNITGNGSLTQSGAGSTVILAGANSYSGGTVINAGTLQVGNGGITGSLAASANVTDNGSLVFDTLGTSQTYSGVISGSGTLTQEGSASTLIFTNTQTYSGGTTISAGTVQIGNGGSTGAIDLAHSIVDNSSLVFDTTSSTGLGQTGVISGIGKVTQEGAGSTLVLSGTNSYTGGTVVSAGTVQVGNVNGLGAATGALAINGGTLDLHGYAITTGAVSGSGGYITDNGTSVTLTIGDGYGVGTFAGVLENGTGTLSLNQIGGFETLTGTNTYSGGTTLSGGTLQIGNTQALGPSTNSLAINGGSLDLHGFSVTVNTLNGGIGFVTSQSGLGTLTVTNGGFFGGTLSDGTNGAGTVALTQTGGKLVLAGNNQYSGTTTINGGTLMIGSGGLTGELNASGLVTNAIVDDGSLVFDNASASGVSQITGILSGSGTLTQEGAGSVLILGGLNSYSGGTLLTAGTIQIGNASALDGFSGALVMRGGTLDLHGTSLNLGTLNGTAGTILSNTAAATLVLNGGGVYSGAMTNGTGTLALDVDGGTLILNGANTYSGGTTITTGTLQVGSGGFTGSIVTTGPISDSGALVFDTSSAVSVAGNITGGGTLTQQGTGTLTLSGTDTYQGTTIIGGGGTLDLAANTGTLYAGSNLTFNGAGGTFNYDNSGSSGGKSQQLGGLAFTSGEGVVQSTLGGASGATLTFSSLAPRQAGATGNFVTSGGTNGSSNSIVLAGQAAGFIDAGTFFDGSTANASYAYENSSGGYVRGIHYGTDADTILSGSGDNIGSAESGTNTTIDNTSNVEIDGAIGNQGNLQIETLQIAGAYNFTQTSGDSLTLLGILKSGGGSSTISGGTLTSNSSTDLVIRADQGSDTLTISDNITSSTTGGITKSGAGTLILSGTNAYTGTTTVDAGTLQMGSGTALGSSSNSLAVNGGTLDLHGNSLTVHALNGSGENAVILDNGSAATLTISTGGTFAGSLQNGTGTLALTQSGGTLLLTGTNTYSGATTVSGGTLQIGANGAGGTLNTSGGLSLANGTSVVFDNSIPGASSSIAGGVTGGGNLTQEGAGSTLILSGTNSYSGSTSILAGTLQIGNGGTGGTLSSSNITDNGALVFDTTNTTPITFSGSISGDGSVTQEGAGSTLILNGSDTYTGGTFLDAGTLELANGNEQASVTVTGGVLDLHGHSTTFDVLNGTSGTILTNTGPATLTVSEGGTYGGMLTDGTSGILSLVEDGGTLILSGTNTYSGGTSIASGTLAVAGPGSLPGTVSIANNSSLELMAGGTYANAISLSGVGSNAQDTEGVTGALYFDANGGTANMTGQLTLGGPTVLTDGATGTLAWNFTGGISGTGGLTFNAAGASGQIVFGLGGTNSFSGGLIVIESAQGSAAAAQDAEVQLLSAGALPTGSSLNLNSGAGLVTSLDLNGYSISVSALEGNVAGTSQIINSSSTPATLTVANAGTDTWAGGLGGTPYGSSVAANNLSIALTGTTDLILTGISSYTGTTSIGTGSTLQLGNGGLGGNLGGGTVTDGGALIFDVAAPVTVANTISGAGTFTQESGYGHTLTLTGTDSYLGATTLAGGNITLAASTASLNGMTGTALNFKSFNGSAGGTFNVDNTGASGAKSQGMGALNFGAGEGVVQSTLGGASSATLSFTSLAARAAGATGDFLTSGGSNGSTNTISIVGQAVGFIDRGIFFAGGTANASYAYDDPSGYVRGINYGVDSGSILSTGGATLTSSDTGNAAGTLTATSNVEMTGAITAQTSLQIGTLQIAGANNFTQATGTTLTVSGILKSGGNAATISGGILTTGGSGDFVIRTDQAGDVLTLSDPISLTTTGGVTKSGAGTLILLATNSYTGGTTIDAGTVQVGNGGTAGSISGTGNVTVEGGAGLVFDTSSNTIFSGNINGAGSLTQDGTGTLVLTGIDGYTGVTTIASGTLQVGNGTSGTLSPSSAIVDDSALVLDTFSVGAISGTGTVTQEGSSVLLITSAETYTGTTTIDGGGGFSLLASIGSLNGSTGTALTFSGAGGLFEYNDNGAVNAETQHMGTLTFQSGEGEVLSMYGSGAINLETLTFSSLAARQAGATGDFVVSGGANGSTNMIQLPGQATGFINAGIFFDGGTANANYAYYDSGGYVRGINYGTDAGSILSTGGATIASNDTGNASSTITSGSHVETTGAITAQTSIQIGTLQISGANSFTQVGGNSLTLAGILKSGGNAATISGGTLTSNSSTDLVIRADQAADSLTISDSITSTTTGGITKSGAGLVILSNANAYTGTTTVDAGTLQMQNAGALGSAANGLAVNGGTLDLHGYSLTAGSLNGAGGTILGNGSGVILTLNGGGTYAGVIGNGTSGTLALDLTAGTQILTGANTYTGGTTISGTGTTLQLGNGGVTGSLAAAGNISVGTGDSLVFDNVNPTSTQISGNITGGGSLTQEGFGNTLVLSGTDTYSGGTTITAGTLQVGNGTGHGSISTTNNVTDNGALIYDAPGSVTFSGSITGTGSLTQEGLSGTLILTQNDSYSGGTTIGANSTLQVDNGGITGALSTTGNILDNGILVFDSGSSGSAVIGGAITGSGTLTQEGSNTVVLAGANTYSGGTTITSGTLQVGNGGVSGSLNPLGAIVDNGALVFDTTAPSETIHGVISGSGTLTQEGAGNTLILAGNETYSVPVVMGVSPTPASTIITAGTLQIGNGGTTGSLAAAGNILDNGALVFDTSSTAVPYSGTISGSGSLTQEGSGTVYLTGTDTYMGGTTVSAGTLELGDGGTTGTIVGNVTDNATLIFDNRNLLTFGGVFTGAGAIVQDGGNTLTFTGNSSSSFTGGYLIESSTLAASGSNVLGAASSVVLSPSTTLDISATNSSQTIGSLASNSNSDTSESVLLGANTLTLGDSSSTTFVGVIQGSGGSLVKQGAGVFTDKGANTYTGGTTINGGTFLADNSTGSATGTGNVTVGSGGTLGGNGSIGPLSGNKISVLSGGDMAPGIAPVGTVATGYLSVVNSSHTLPIMNFAAPSSSAPQLTFDLGSGSGPSVSGPTLAGSSTFISVTNPAGDSPNEIVFNNNLVQLNDLTSGNLVYGDYLLFQAPNADDYKNLTTAGNGQILSGLSLAADPAFSDDYSGTLMLEGGDIYVDVGVVPEPGTWALLLVGSSLLFFYRRALSRSADQS